MKEKIHNLFALRHIPELIVWAGLDKDAGFLSKLEQLQLSIYDLDKYLEQNWAQDQGRINDLWETIYSKLSPLGIKDSEKEHLCRHIKKYEILERGLRHGHLLSRMPIRNAYMIKSCDVKLVRQLVFIHSHDLLSTHMESDWILFDLFSEVLDDLSDVNEDMQTFNGNRFLISLIEGEQEDAFYEYRRFLLQLKKELDHLPEEGLTIEQKHIRSWTGRICDATQDLLITRESETGDFDPAETALGRQLSERVH